MFDTKPLVIFMERLIQKYGLAKVIFAVNCILLPPVICWKLIEIVPQLLH